MSIDVQMSCEKPGDIRYTLKITMSATDWEKLRDQIDAGDRKWSYPAGDLRIHITDLLAQARKIYWPER